MQISRNRQRWRSAGDGRPVLMRQAKENAMHNCIIDAIQEQYGEKYATLEDALNWWAWPEHWRRGAWDSDFVIGYDIDTEE